MNYKITLEYQSDSICGDESCCFEEWYDGIIYWIFENESGVFDEFEYQIINKEHEFINNIETIAGILNLLNNRSKNLHWNIDFNQQNTVIEII